MKVVINVRQDHINRYEEVKDRSFSPNYCCPIQQAVKEVVREDLVPNVGSQEISLESGTYCKEEELGIKSLYRGETVYSVFLPEKPFGFIRGLHWYESDQFLRDSGGTSTAPAPEPFSFELDIPEEFLRNGT